MKNLEKGVSLIITFFVLVIVLAVVLSISVILYNELKIIRNIGDSVVAFYAADSGVEKTLYYDRKVLPEDMAGSMRGICNICNYENCTLKAEVGGDVNGCNDLTCENCEVAFDVAFDLDLLNGKKCEIKAKVSQVSSLDANPLQFSVLNINSVGFYRSVLGADQIKRAIEINLSKQENNQPNQPLAVSASASPNPAIVGDIVTFSASVSGGEGGYVYNWTGDCEGSDQTCVISFSSAGSYTATVEVTSGLEGASASATVEVSSFLFVSASASPNPANVGDTVTFSATPSGGTGSYTYNWENIVCDTGQTSRECFKSFSLRNTYPARVTVISGTQSVSADTSVVVTAPWTCGVDRLIDSRDDKTYATVQIGNQCWMAENINVGTFVLGANEQGTSCSSINKYCYNNLESNCALFGGLYQWNQSICSSGSGCNGAGAPPNDACSSPIQGICPDGWHIPSNHELTTLERAVCTSATCATDFPYNGTTLGMRGTNEGTKLKLGGSSGFNALLAGFRTYNGLFSVKDTAGYIWSSWRYDSTNAWHRVFYSTDSKSGRDGGYKLAGFSVRCIKN